MVTAESLGHQANGPLLVPPAGPDPVLKGLLRVEPQVMKPPGLGLDDPAGRPFLLLGPGLRQPLGGIVFAHDRCWIESLHAELAASVVPAGLHRLPVALVQVADVDAVAVVPPAVAMVVGEAFSGGVVIAIDVLDGTVGVLDPHCFSRGPEERLQLGTGQLSVSDTLAVCANRFVNIGDQDARWM